MDHYTALLLGRPAAISDRACDAGPPLNINDSGVEVPLHQATSSSFHHWRHRLAGIMSVIAAEGFAIIEPPYETIVRIDRSLLDWLASLPDDLAPRVNLTRPGAEQAKLVNTQRYLLSTEFNFARTCLHRRYMARRDPGNVYRLSRDACVASATEDLLARSTFGMSGYENFGTGSYRILNSLVILG